MFEFIDVKYKSILDIPALKIEKGKITTIVGESGSGKTTILKLLNKMISPTQGRILYQGCELSEIDTVMHRRQVTMLSQTPIVFDGNVQENLTIGLRYQDKSVPDEFALNRMLEQIRLKKELDSPVDKLSGGEKQRLAVGRILLLDSPVYLLDEPSSALDEDTEEVIIEMITRNIRQNAKTLVMVTHSKSIAQNYSDTILRIADGSIQEEER